MEGNRRAGRCPIPSRASGALWGGVLTIALAAGALAQSAHAGKSGKGPSANKIVEEMLDRDPLGYGGAEARVLMVLVNSRNHEQRRKMTSFSRTDGEKRYSFIRFNTPADIAGTAFLGLDNDGKRKQYIYLPAAAKARRISSGQRNSRFVGTDFSYADLDNRDIDDSTRQRLADEKVGKTACYVVEARPTHKKSKYARIRLWIGKKTWLPLRMRFFNKKGTEIKRFTAREIKKVEGRWIITESKMVDLERKHTTVLKVVDITLRDDVPLEQFTVRALDRG